MRKKNYLSLIILIIIFILPGIAAYVVYTNPDLLGKNSINHGDFVKPPILIKSIVNNKKWRLVYYSKDACHLSCMANLDKLARIRLALGRRLYDVDGYLLLSTQSKNLTHNQEKTLQDINVFVLKLSPQILKSSYIFKNNGYFILNPDGYIVMSFDADSLSEDIFQDLKKLVNN